jgi:hypothetical protein
MAISYFIRHFLGDPDRRASPRGCDNWMLGAVILYLVTEGLWLVVRRWRGRFPQP